MSYECPPTPTSPRGHARRASVPLSPFWIDPDASKDDDEAIASPRAREKGVAAVSMEDIAFFPMPLLDDECSAERAFYHPDKRLSERRQPQHLPRDAVSSQRVIIEGKREVDKAADTESVTSSADTVHSEFSENTAGSIWEDVPMAKPDAILGIAQAYKNSPDPRKVNVCVGAYRDENGNPWVLPSVREAEKKIWENEQENKEYLPIDGDRTFVEVAMRFAYGPDMPLEHLAGVQTLSGTGACRVGGCFLATFNPGKSIYVPNPTWGNHINIFTECGLDVRRYRYYSKQKSGLDLENMLKDIRKAPHGSTILLHACAHNPTGSDPTIHEWKEIIAVIKQRNHIAFFDCAYQGFASGDAEADAAPFRYAVSQHVPILLAQSFAKNFGLYGERCGTLSVVCGDAEQQERILSELRLIIRPMYSSPPKHGSSIVKTVLLDPVLNKQYYEECTKMARRIQEMRIKLVDKLVNVAKSEHDWSHITKQIGMFAFTGMNAEMCQQLTNEYAIFLTTNGRISISGLNDSNVEYVAMAIHAVTKGKSITE